MLMTAPESQIDVAAQAPLFLCTKCRTNKSADRFYIRNTRTGLRHKQCVDCIRTYAKTYAAKNRTAHIKYCQEYYLKRTEGLGLRRRSEGGRHEGIRQFMEALKSNPCMDCGQRFPTACMDLDHRPGTQKLFNLAAVRGRALSDEVLMEEIMKCDLVCSNCHRIRTSRRLSQ